LKILESLKPPRDDKVNPAEHPESSSVAQSPVDECDTQVEGVEKFFKSRIDHVIENILKYIELDELLNHIIQKNDQDIRYSNLSAVIQSIFKETRSENVVIKYACKSAEKLNFLSFENCNMDTSTGILFRFK